MKQKKLSKKTVHFNYRKVAVEIHLRFSFLLGLSALFNDSSSHMSKWQSNWKLEKEGLSWRCIRPSHVMSSSRVNQQMRLSLTSWTLDTNSEASGLYWGSICRQSRTWSKIIVEFQRICYSSAKLWHSLVTSTACKLFILVPTQL